jgi:murein DD-endopeptidase MepM/ murein hydrolase activator NlpD
MSMDYLYIIREFNSIEEIKNRNRKLGKQLYSYKVKVEEIENTLERLKALTTKLKIISNLADAEERSKIFSAEAEAIEGVDDFSMVSDSEMDNEFRGMQARLKDIYYKMEYQEEDLNKLNEYLEEQSALLASTPSIIPVKGWITSYFGSRIDPFTRKLAKHEGIDISARSGTTIVAPADGVVTFAGNKPGYGVTLTIDHGYGITTVYGHNSKLFVAQGKKVKRGMPISAVGSTGRSTGPHLHYEVRVNGITVDPRKFILDNPWE